MVRMAGLMANTLTEHRGVDLPDTSSWTLVRTKDAKRQRVCIPSLGVVARVIHLPLKLPPVCFARPTRSTRCARSILLLLLNAPSHILGLLHALHVLQTSWEEWPQQYGYEYEPRYEYQPMKTDPETMPSSS